MVPDQPLPESPVTDSPPVSRTVVGLARPGGESGLRAAAERAVGLAGGWGNLVRPGTRVLVKPNLVAVPPHPRQGAVTDAGVCRAVADLVREGGGEPLIADSAAVGADTEDVMAVCGYRALREEGYRVADLKRTELAEVAVPAGLALSRLKVYRPALEADLIISVPVLKTHDQLEVSLALKNLKGVVPDAEKKRFHAVGVVEAICDLLTVLPPVYALLDGTVGQEGLGPVFGTPVEMGIILAGSDPVAADTVAGWLMGFAPEELPLQARAATRGLGCADLESIRIVGEDPVRVRRRFQRAAEDARLRVPGLEVVFGGGTCSGCHYTALSVLVEMKERDLLAHLAGKRIFTGRPDSPCGIPGDLPPEHLILVGACLAPFRARGTWVPGCPPRNSWLLQVLVPGASREES